LPAGIPDALLKLQQESRDDLEVEQAIQFASMNSGQALRSYCAERDIRFIGDVAIFVNFDSADVWTHLKYLSCARTSHRFALPVFPGLFQCDGPAVGQPDL